METPESDGLPDVRTAYVRLSPTHHDNLRVRAAAAGVTPGRYLARLLRDYGSEQAETVRRQRDTELVEVRIPMWSDDYDRAVHRARTEGKPGLSRVVIELLEDEVEPKGRYASE